VKAGAVKFLSLSFLKANPNYIVDSIEFLLPRVFLNVEKRKRVLATIANLKILNHPFFQNLNDVNLEADTNEVQNKFKRNPKKKQTFLT
jgi:hypothetical protein